MKIERKNSLDKMILVGNLFGGKLRYSSAENGPYLRFGEPPYHVDIRKGDSIVKKGGKAVITNSFVKTKLAVAKKNPEMSYLIDMLESKVTSTIDIEKKKR